jgi:hypothetical protein
MLVAFQGYSFPRSCVGMQTVAEPSTDMDSHAGAWEPGELSGNNESTGYTAIFQSLNSGFSYNSQSMRCI